MLGENLKVLTLCDGRHQGNEDITDNRYFVNVTFYWMWLTHFIGLDEIYLNSFWNKPKNNDNHP